MEGLFSILFYSSEFYFKVDQQYRKQTDYCIANNHR